METYSVKLDNGKITYTQSIYGCDECGWVDTDKSFFYESGGEIFCSLHKKE